MCVDYTHRCHRAQTSCDMHWHCVDDGMKLALCTGLTPLCACHLVRDMALVGDVHETDEEGAAYGILIVCSIDTTKQGHGILMHSTLAHIDRSIPYCSSSVGVTSVTCLTARLISCYITAGRTGCGAASGAQPACVGLPRPVKPLLPPGAGGAGGKQLWILHEQAHAAPACAIVGRLATDCSRRPRSGGHSIHLLSRTQQGMQLPYAPRDTSSLQCAVRCSCVCCCDLRIAYSLLGRVRRLRSRGVMTTHPPPAATSTRCGTRSSNSSWMTHKCRH